MSDHTGYSYYIKHGGGYIRKFLERNPEFDCDGFIDYVIDHNRADRDSGELQDVAKHEVLRLAAEYEEGRWRFPNVYGEPKE